MAPDVPALRQALLDFVDRKRGEVLAKNYGTQRPDPGKLIREGLTIGQRCVETVAGADPTAYLEAVARALEAAHAEQSRHELSDDGWKDEDGYILAGINDVRREVERLR